jgi:type II secretory pathway component GspD/PulD (secretin)
MFDRLADPQMQTQLGLTAEQNEAVKKIIAERDAALAQAPADDHAAVLVDAEKRISAVLSPAQREHLASVDALDKLRLRFSFRYQPWADVLSWFAEQAGLSLVLDAPPPGTFNYSDTREYTVPEAIDLLNGVLLGKGYTLLRRERMLMLVDLANGLPIDLVPRVTLDESARRGKYELVSVVFPIDERNPEDVKTEIQPLLGTHGQISLLPKTKQVLVTDTAGKMKPIEAVIQSMPGPAKPEPKPEPPKPQLAVLPLEGLDAKATVDILSALFPDVKLVHDAKVDQLMAHTTPEKQTAILAVLTQLRSDAAADKKPRLEKYPVKQEDRDELITLLRVVAPDATLRFDRDSGELIAWATPEQHVALAQNIEKLGQSAAAAGERQLEVHPMRKSDPSAALTILQKMLPEARLAVDTATKSVVALATVDDQKAIRATIEQLEANTLAKPTLKSYPLTVEQSKRAQAALTALAADLPGVRVVPDGSDKGLTVFATEEQHALVSNIIEQVSKEPDTDEALEVRSYRIRTADLTSVLTVLQTLLPDVKFVSDAKAKQIIAWARPADQDKVRQTVEQLDQELPEDERMELLSHPLGEASADAVLGVLRTVLPTVQVISDSKNSSLVAFAAKRDQQVVRRAIEQSQPNTPEAERMKAVVYEVHDADPLQLSSMLASVYPTARFSGDRAAMKLIAWAKPADQESIAATVEGMRKQESPDRELKPVVYHPKSANVTTLLADLRLLAPDARLAGDPQNGSLVVWANDQDHAKIRQTIEGLDAADANPHALVAQIYRPKTADVTTLLADLRALVPEARLVADAKHTALIAWAKAADHAKIKATVDGLDAVEPSGDRRVAVYQAADTDAATLMLLLQAAVPEARYVPDTRSGTVMAWASTDQHATLKKAVEQIGTGDDALNKRVAKVYRFENSDANAALAVLRPLVPYAYLAVDARTGSLAATASPTEHELIQATVDGLEKAKPTGDRQVAVYQAADTDAATLMLLLQAAVPEGRYVPDTRSGTVMAWASADQHATLKKAVEQVGAGDGALNKRIAKVYRFENSDANAALAVLRPLVPYAYLAVDARTGSLAATASPTEHELIQATVDGLEMAKATGDRHVAVYQAADTDASTLMLLLQAAVPEGRYVPDTRSGTVMAWASADQHATLKEAVDHLDATDASANKRVAKVYRFKNGDASAALSVLRSLVPYAYLAVDARTGSLAATALPSEHEQIAAMVEQMEGTGAGLADLQLRVYSVDSADPANVLDMLRDLFAQRPEVRFAVDSKSGKLAAWAMPSQHQSIEEVIQRVAGPGADVDDRQVEVYPLGAADPESVARALEAMYANDRQVKIVPDERGGFVTIWGSPAVQASVKAVIEQMQQGQDQEVAVFALEVIDPYTAQTSVEELFGDPRSRGRAGAPRIEIDPDGHQLLVRASKDQLAQIRQLLAKMGETQLATTSTTSDRRMRVLPISERSLKAALAQIERVWPKLRDNPIRVVTPSALAPTMRNDRLQREADSADPITHGPDAPPSDEGGGGCEQAAGAEPEATSEQTKTSGPTAEEPAAEANAPADDQPAASTQEAAEAPQGKPAAPAIVIAPSGDSITISSDDPEALDQFEQMLKSFVQRGGAGGREFSIFNLKRANAINVAETLQNVLTGGGFGFRGFSNATVVPDQRLNAVIVQANRNDMGMIESLIETLDSEESTAQGAGPKPKLIPVKNTDVERIAAILRDIYKTQLTAGGARRQMPLPQRMPREMAALIQQINATNTGPEMTLGVDQATNSLVVSAPPPLLSEIETLVATLDEQSNASKPTVRVVALKNISTKALEKALENMLQENRRRSRISQ